MKRLLQRKPRPTIEGTIHCHIVMPQSLHDAMKAIRQARHRLEGSDVKLSRIYREATEQFVNAKPQQDLLTRRRPASMETAG